MSAKRSNPTVETDRQRPVEPARRRWPRVVGLSLLGLVVAGRGLSARAYSGGAHIGGSPCADIPSILPQGSKITDHLGQVEVYELGGNAGEALLLPTGKSCVVISVASAAK